GRDGFSAELRRVAIGAQEKTLAAGGGRRRGGVLRSGKKKLARKSPKPLREPLLGLPVTGVNELVGQPVVDRLAPISADIPEADLDRDGRERSKCRPPTLVMPRKVHKNIDTILFDLPSQPGIAEVANVPPQVRRPLDI